MRHEFQIHRRGLERRLHAGSRLRIQRRDAGSETPQGREQIVGHAAVFNSETVLYSGKYWEYREIIRPGAFARAIADKQDVRCLFNHDPNFVLGRTTSGTLTLSEDTVGLFSITDPPDTQTIRDLVVSPIDRGDISGMSFAFTPRISDKIVRTENADGSQTIDAGGIRILIRYEGDREIQTDEIIDCDLYDVSPVTYPAYESTGCEVSARSIPSLAAMIAERDVPHRKPTPILDESRRNLDARITARSNRQGTAAAPGQGKPR